MKVPREFQAIFIRGQFSVLLSWTEFMTISIMVIFKLRKTVKINCINLNFDFLKLLIIWNKLFNIYYLKTEYLQFKLMIIIIISSPYSTTYCEVNYDFKIYHFMLIVKRVIPLVKNFIEQFKKNFLSLKALIQLIRD